MERLSSTPKPIEVLSPRLQQLIVSGQLSIDWSPTREAVSAHCSFRFYDDDLAELCKLRTLRTLDCDNSMITDVGMKHVVSLQMLESLSIVRTPVTGKGLAVIVSLPHLSEVACNPEDDLSEAIDAILKCRTLKALNCDSAMFTDEHYSHIFQLPLLERLNMSQNSAISDEAFRNVAAACRLQSLSCSDIDRIGDLSCRYLAESKGLRKLLIGSTMVSDNGVTHLARIQTLTSLNLADTKITPRSLELLASLPSLEELSIDNIELCDEHIGLVNRLTKLKSLSVDGSQMSKKGARRLIALRNWERFHAYPQIGDYYDDER